MKGFYVAEALFFISVFVFLITLVIIWPYLFGQDEKHMVSPPFRKRNLRLGIRLRYLIKKIKYHYKQARGKTHLIWVS